MENTTQSGWAFQLNYQSQLSVPSRKATLKNHAKRMVDRFLKLCADAQVSAANSLNLVSA